MKILQGLKISSSVRGSEMVEELAPYPALF